MILILPMISNKILTPKSISAVDKLAQAINTNTTHTEPIIGINAFLTSLMFSCFLVSILARKVISAILAKSEV
ncbi:hypothetical protein D3C87_1639540 [compost metagenome]